LLPAAGYSIFLETLVVAGLTALLGLVGLFAAPVFFFIALLLPVPPAYLVVKRSLGHGLLALFLSAAMLLGVVGQLLPVLWLLLQFGLLGLITGLLIKNRANFERIAAVLLAWSLVAAAGNLIYSYALSGAGFSQVTAEIDAAMQEMYRIYGQSGAVDEVGRQHLMEAADRMGYLVRVFLPGSTVVWTAATTMASFFITRRVLQGFGYRTPGGLRFSELKLPWYSIWLIIAGLAMTLAGEEFTLELLGMAGKNILFVSAFIFFILGLSVSVYYLQAWRVAKAVKIIVAALVILYLPFAVLAVGVLDPVVNLRRLPAGDDGKKGG